MTAASRERLLILGAGGFIGSHLLKPLLESENYRIHGLDISSSKIEHLLHHPDFEFEHLDVHDSDAVRERVRWADTVVSLVAICNPAEYNQRPLEVIDINFVRPLELVKMCAEHNKRLIHFSTSEVYGKTVQGVAGADLRDPEAEQHFVLKEDESPLIMGPVSAQRWSYAAAKQLIERVIYAYGHEGELEYTIVRPLNFVGARMDYIPGVDGEGVPRVLACFMDALLHDKPLQLVDGGQARRCFTAIDEAIDAIIRIIERREASRNQIFHIGNPENECTIEELAHLMIDVYRELRPEIADTEFEVIEVSSEEFYGEGYEDCDRRVPDISKARDLLGWEPRMDLRTSIKTAVASFISDYGDQVQTGSEQLLERFKS